MHLSELSVREAGVYKDNLSEGCVRYEGCSSAIMEIGGFTVYLRGGSIGAIVMADVTDLGEAYADE